MVVIVTREGFVDREGRKVDVRRLFYEKGCLTFVTGDKEIKVEKDSPGLNVYENGKWTSWCRCDIRAVCNTLLDPYIGFRAKMPYNEKPPKHDIGQLQIPRMAPSEEALESLSKLTNLAAKMELERKASFSYAFLSAGLDLDKEEQARPLLEALGIPPAYWPASAAFWTPVFRYAQRQGKAILLCFSVNGINAGSSEGGCHMTVDHAVHMAKAIWDEMGLPSKIHATPKWVYVLVPSDTDHPIVYADHGSDYGGLTGYLTENWYYLLHELKAPEPVEVIPSKFV